MLADFVSFGLGVIPEAMRYYTEWAKNRATFKVYDSCVT